MIYLDYVWLDGNKAQQLRSKTKVINKNHNKFKFEEIKESLIEKMSHPLVSEWSFDGSSVLMADVSNSELILKPVNIFLDPFRFGQNSYIVLCEVFHPDGKSHKTNKRIDLRNMMEYDNETIVGYEQEYFIYDVNYNRPLGWPDKGFPRTQGDFYCSVGGNNTFGRDFIERHAEYCINAGLEFTGINLEVACGQAEYQIGAAPTLECCDQLWISRYILHRLSETYNYSINLEPKPFKGNEINGSGCHVNFSTKSMREDIKNKKALVIEACHLLGQRVSEHIKVYGEGNADRLTGANETCSINDFKFGIGDRTASIRIPSSINDDRSAGYLEDRRPASNMNPYEVMTVMLETICQKVSQKKEAELA